MTTQPPLKRPRIKSIDLLKGFVMVLMALDHTRDYFYQSGAFFDVSNPATATVPVYITRIITHVCAPTFSFLAGISAFMTGKRRSKAGLSAFLFTRGLWLVFMTYQKSIHRTPRGNVLVTRGKSGSRSSTKIPWSCLQCFLTLRWIA